MAEVLPRENQSSVSEFILLGFSCPPKMQWLLFATFLTVYLIILLGNGVMITLIERESQLHTPMYFFLVNLAFLDIIYTTTTMPQMLMHLLSKRKVISYAGCVAQMYIFLSLGITECVLYAVMAYDRYVAICQPLRYTAIMNRPVCLRMAVGTWACGFLFAMMHTGFTMRLPYCGPNEINHFFCEVPAILKLACADTRVNEMVDFVLGVILLMIPLSLIVLSYIFILAAILRIHSSGGKYKALSTCTSHIMVVTFFYGAAMFMYMRPASIYEPERDKKFSLFYNVVSPFLNPFIYGLRNKEVKEAFFKLVCKLEGPK